MKEKKVIEMIGNKLKGRKEDVEVAEKLRENFIKKMLDRFIVSEDDEEKMMIVEAIRYSLQIEEASDFLKINFKS